MGMGNGEWGNSLSLFPSRSPFPIPHSPFPISSTLSSASFVGVGRLERLDLERAIDSLPKIDRALRDLSGLVRLWDEAIRIPGLGWQIGLDAIIGLVPGVGDLIGAVVSSYLVVV